jgi:hypothetical protein
MSSYATSSHAVGDSLPCLPLPLEGVQWKKGAKVSQPFRAVDKLGGYASRELSRQDRGQAGAVGPSCAPRCGAIGGKTRNSSAGSTSICPVSAYEPTTADAEALLEGLLATIAADKLIDRSGLDKEHLSLLEIALQGRAMKEEEPDVAEGENFA